MECFDAISISKTKSLQTREILNELDQNNSLDLPLRPSY